MPAGGNMWVGRTRSASCAPPMRLDSRTWCRCGTAACCDRLGRSTAGRRVNHDRHRGETDPHDRHHRVARRNRVGKIRRRLSIERHRFRCVAGPRGRTSLRSFGVSLGDRPRLLEAIAARSGSAAETPAPRPRRGSAGRAHAGASAGRAGVGAVGGTAAADRPVRRSRRLNGPVASARRGRSARRAAGIP